MAKLQLLKNAVLSVWFVWPIYITVTLVLFLTLNTKNPHPLVDEVFHVPQATLFCRGVFSRWDPKITTLPGLYVITVAFVRIAGCFFDFDVCSIYTFRLFNVFVSFCNFFLIYIVQQKISSLGRWCDGRKCSPSACKGRDLFTTVNTTMFPVLYFFTFFYYTEQLSTFTVLLTYLLSLNNQRREAAIAGLVSVLVRQTNIIWILFIILTRFFSLLQQDMISVGHYSKALKDEKFVPMIMAMVYHIFYSLRNRWDVSKVFVKNYIIEMHYYLYVCEAFAIFVIINGGIVVGDKGAHEAVVHLPQMLYFFLFTVVFCAPYFMLLVAPFLNWLKNNRVMAVACIVVCALVIHYNSLVHPYLLADNRHYAFYIWKYLFEKNLYFRYLLIPVYVYGGYCVTFFLHEYSFAYKFAYLICVFLILVPQKLLEFRYFILPFIIFRLNVYPKFYWQLVMEFFIYIVINMATVNLFLTREICWDDMYDVQRFMW